MTAVKKIFLSVFVNKNFLKLWLAQILSQSSVNILTFVLAISAYNATKSNGAVSYVIISFGVAALIFGAPAGVIVDYLDNKKTLVWSIILRALFILILLFATNNLLVTVALAFILNSITQFFFPAEASAIPLIVKRGDLLSANSIYSMTYFIAQIIGFVSAGFLLEMLQFNFTIVFLTILFLISAYLVYTINFPPSEKIKLNLSKLSDQVILEFKKGVSYIKRHNNVKLPIYYLALSQVLTGTLLTLLPGYAVEVLGLKVEQTSLYLVAPVAVGMVIGSIYLNRFGKKLNRDKIVNIGFIGGFISLAMLSVIHRVGFEMFSRNIQISKNLPFAYNTFLGVDLLFFSILFMGCAGLFNAFIIIVNNTRLQSKTEEKMRGRIYGVLQTGVTIAAFLPILLAGHLADVFGINKIIFAIALLMLMAYAVVKPRHADHRSTTVNRPF